MELRHLRYFVAVAEELNFTRAAARLYIAQPPLSTQIQNLEREVGTPLFERIKRGVFLTQAGRIFLVRARAILTAADAAKEDARRAANGEVGRLDVGFSASSILTSRLPAALRAFQAAHPSVELRVQEMSSTHQLEGIHQRTLDLGVVRKPEVHLPSGIAMRQWYTAPLIAAIPQRHVLLRGRGIAMSELRDAPLIVYRKDAGTGLYWKVLSLCAESGFRPRHLHEARDAATMVGLVAAGFGVAILPGEAQCIRQDGVLYEDIVDSNAVSSMYFAFRDRDPNPHLKLLLDCLQDTIASR